MSNGRRSISGLSLGNAPSSPLHRRSTELEKIEGLARSSVLASGLLGVSSSVSEGDLFVSILFAPGVHQAGLIGGARKISSCLRLALSEAENFGGSRNLCGVGGAGSGALGKALRPLEDEAFVFILSDWGTIGCTDCRLGQSLRRMFSFKRAGEGVELA